MRAPTSEPPPSVRSAALQAIREQLARATAAKKCHACGCLRGTVDALATTPLGAGALGEALDAARAVLAPAAYDCLGCAECWPAVAANHLAEAFPELAAGLDVCPTEPPEERAGWPPLPGAYHVLRARAPVAVCTLSDDALAERLAARAPEGLALVGTLLTENLGIERILRNVLANPALRFLVLCGQDGEQAVGHRAGQSLERLVAEGIDERGRIRGAFGKRPVLANVTGAQVAAFRRQIEIVSLVGERDEAVIQDAVRACAARDPGPFEGAPGDDDAVLVVRAEPPRRHVPDPAGYFVLHPDPRRRLLVLEHYTVAGLLDCVVEGDSPAAVCAEAIAQRLLTRLDHAAYLGRELARAERCLATGERYVQDRAPGGP